MPTFGFTPEQERLMALPFRMTIEDVFDVKGRGVAIVGRIETGTLREGDALVIMGNGEPIHTQARQIEWRGRIEMDPVTRWAGDTVGIFLSREMTKDQIQQGMIVTRKDEA